MAMADGGPQILRIAEDPAGASQPDGRFAARPNPNFPMGRNLPDRSLFLQHIEPNCLVNERAIRIDAFLRAGRLIHLVSERAGYRQNVSLRIGADVREYAAQDDAPTDARAGKQANRPPAPNGRIGRLARSWRNFHPAAYAQR